MKRLLLLTIACLYAALAGAVPVDPAALTRELAALQASSKLAGFGVAIVTPEGVAYQQGFGFADVGRQLPYTPATTQNIGSVSKTVTAVAVAKAIELGYFTLDTPINGLLPFQVASPQPITVRQLVSHTSGIVDDDDVYGATYFLNAYSDAGSPLASRFVMAARDDASLGGFLRHYLARDGRHFKPTNLRAAGSYKYSNIGAALAGYLVEVKSGMGFDAFCQQHIFGPLGMRHTSWHWNAANARTRAQLYDLQKQAFPVYSALTYPDGGLVTDVRDLALFLQAMMRGHAGQPGVLGPQGFALVFNPLFPVGAQPPNSPKGDAAGGIFWRIKADGLVGHTGSDPGITAFMYFDPVQKLGRIFVTNTEFDGPDGEVDATVQQQFRTIWKALEGAR